MALTDTAIKALRPRGKRYKVFDGQGLHLEVQPSGLKVWRIKYRFGGKEKRPTIGHYPLVSLREARAIRAVVMEKLHCGQDPYPRSVTPAQGVTFAEVASDWMVRQAPRWGDKHRQIIERRLELYVFPHIGSEPVASISPPQVLGLLRQIEGRGKAETASRVRGTCSQVFRYGVACGHCPFDPCRDLQGALTAHVEVARPALTRKADVAGLMASIDSYAGYSVTRYALYWSAYTFCRPGEVRRAEWSEIFWDEGEWRIPAEKMKMRFEHIVPLSRQCLSILEELKGRKYSDVWIFPGPRRSRPLSANGVLSALRRMGYEKHEMTAHGFRAMASTLLNELGYRPDVIERQLAHGDPDKIRAVYNRAEYLDERRVMMQAWADYLDALARGVSSPRIQPGTGE